MKMFLRFVYFCSLIIFYLVSNAQLVTKYTKTDLNLRSGEGTNYSVLTTIPKGTPVIMYECNCNWVYVSYNGYVGYVSSRYLTKQKPLTIKKSTKSILSNNRYYTNVNGYSVHSPAYSSGGVPTGAVALCRDGTYSFSRHRRGTCSHHGGVARWF